MRVPGFARLYTGLLLGRMGGSMMFVALVLFVLQRYHSPQLAGLTAFMAALPGVVVSPLAGALLDRYGRARLVVLDYAVAAVALGSIAALSAAHSLPPPLLLAIVTISSLTNPLSWAGARSLFPILAPRHLWERANGLDSSGHVIATLLASPLAGVLVGLFGGEWALAVSGGVFVGAAAVMLRLPDPPSAAAQVGSVLQNAWLGLVYTLRNPTLRGLALTLSTFNIGGGLLVIAVPVLILDRLHAGPATVGLVWGGMGGALFPRSLPAASRARAGSDSLWSARSWSSPPPSRYSPLPTTSRWSRLRSSWLVWRTGPSTSGCSRCGSDGPTPHGSDGRLPSPCRSTQWEIRSGRRSQVR